MMNLRKALSLQSLLVLVAIVYLVSVVRAWRANAQTELDRSQTVPILMSPSIQPGKGQGVLIKVTNISGNRPAAVRLTFFNETDLAPIGTQDFPAIKPRTTVTHLHVPPSATLALNGTTFDAPAPVRTIIQPMGGGDAGTVRRVVATVMMVNLKPATPNAPALSLDPPVFVPLERCLFASIGMVPYTGGTYLYDCAPTLVDLPNARADGE